jgi:hypothetical protein
MPWTSGDAHRFTKKAKSGVAKRQWAHVADSALKRTGDEGLAIREANSVVKKRGTMAKESKSPYHVTHITHHDDGSHTVEHEHHRKVASKSGAFMERPENESYSVGSGKELMGKLQEHLGIGAAKAPKNEEKELEAAEHEPPHEGDAEEEETSEGV